MLEHLEPRSSLGSYTILLDYEKNTYMRYLIQTLLVKNYNVDSNYFVEVKTEKELTQAEKDTGIRPLLGDRWLVLIDGDKIPFKRLLKLLEEPTSNALYVVFLTYYRNFMNLTNNKSATLKRTNQVLRLSSISSHDVSIVANFYNTFTKGTGKAVLSDTLMTYVKKNYLYSPDVVCQLFSMLKSGVSVTTEKELVDLIGFGRVSAEYVTLELLGLVNLKATDRRLKYILRLLKQLVEVYSALVVYNRIVSFLHGILLYKIYVISGTSEKEVEASLSSDEYRQYKSIKRYKRIVTEEVPLHLVLSLQHIMLKHRNSETFYSDSEICLLSAVTEYVGEYAKDTSQKGGKKC